MIHVHMYMYTSTRFQAAHVQMYDKRISCVFNLFLKYSGCKKKFIVLYSFFNYAGTQYLKTFIIHVFDAVIVEVVPESEVEAGLVGLADGGHLLGHLLLHLRVVGRFRRPAPVTHHQEPQAVQARGACSRGGGYTIIQTSENYLVLQIGGNKYNNSNNNSNNNSSNNNSSSSSSINNYNNQAINV